MDHAIHAPDPVKNIVDSLNGTDKRYLKEQMELIRKLASKNTSKVRIITIESKYISIHFSEQCLNIITKNDRLNGLKGGTKMKNTESLFKSKANL